MAKYAAVQPALLLYRFQILLKAADANANRMTNSF